MAEERPRRTVAQDPQKEAERKRLIEEAKARWAAKKAEGGGAAAAPAAARPQEARAAAQAPTVPVPVASHNPGGSPITAPANPNLVAVGTVNQAVEIQADPTEEANLRKLLGGLGAYQNPLRRGAWQVDYRYWKEARRRLEAAGYKVEGRDYMGRPLDEWDPLTRGWVRVEP
ncbi:MAG: hypothetical protein RMM30_11310 [Armatimonadota bacterium]|nr:hypothetical protein [Armatimonadota bacterium]MDW8157159.1 hypothetical protein [Armatimonadota bacterium]